MKFLAFFVLFTALTKTYVFWATHLHVSVGTITILFSLFTLILILYYSQNLIIKVPKRWFRPLVIFLLIGPIVVIILTQNVNIRHLLLQLFFIFLFILTYQSYQSYGIKWMYKVFFVSMIFTVITGIVSVGYASLFIRYGDIIGGLPFYGGRAFGFYLQPNSYAFAINLLFIGLLLLSPKVKHLLYLYPIILITIILSGSRSNLLGLAVITLFFIVYLFRKNKKILIKSIVSLSLVLVVTGVGLLKGYELLSSNSDYAYLKTRIDFLIHLTEESNVGVLAQVSEEGTMQDRARYQNVYLEMIYNSPLVGYGFGIQKKLMEEGKLIGSAHNIMYEILLQGGMVYGLFFIYFISAYTKNYFFYRKMREKDHRYLLSLGGLLAFMFLYFFFTTTFFYERIVFILFAVLAYYGSNKNSQVRKT